MKNTWYLFLLLIVLASCEDKVDLSKTLTSGKPALVVDAFLANLPSNQVVRLTSSQYYFDNSGPKLIQGASVVLKDLAAQVEYGFSETSPGLYTSPVKGDSMLLLGHSYELVVKHDGQEYHSYSTMMPVPPIDSIFFEQIKDFNDEPIKGKYDAEFRSMDMPGFGDRVWIRHYKNERRNTGPDNVAISYDGGFSGAADADGKMFIYPLRRFSINEQEEDEKWVDGDKCMVELYSVSDDAAFFIQSMVTQATLGEGGPLGALFSAPPANVPTNIVNVTSKEKEAAGYFCTSAVARAETTVPNAYGRIK